MHCQRLLDGESLFSLNRRRIGRDKGSFYLLFSPGFEGIHRHSNALLLVGEELIETVRSYLSVQMDVGAFHLMDVGAIPFSTRDGRLSDGDGEGCRLVAMTCTVLIYYLTLCLVESSLSAGLVEIY